MTGFALQRFGQYKESNQASSLKQRDYKDATDLVLSMVELKGGDAMTDVSNCETAVRRLTPLECERLQGFPDNWTNIGEWTDSNGKLHKESTDSARYKAIGNSICTPFWKWMARRICAQYERDVTMGSLFDGVGGFPLVFEQVGAKAIWASEIEEFPIAVTKRHFPEEEGDL